MVTNVGARPFTKGRLQRSALKIFWNHPTKTAWPSKRIWTTYFQRASNLGTSYMRADTMRNNNQIFQDGQTIRDKFLHGRPRLLTRDLFAVANLLVYFRVLTHRN